MARLVFTIPEQTFSFDIEDGDQLDMFRQAIIDEESGADPYGLMDAADMWTSDVHSGIDIDIEFIDE